MKSTFYKCLILFFHCLANSKDFNATVKTDWLDLSSWINSHGGYVDPNFTGSITYHSGFDIRGVVSTIAAGEQVVFRVPKKLWFSLDNFPDFNNAELDQVPNCSRTVNG